MTLLTRLGRLVAFATLFVSPMLAQQVPLQLLVTQSGNAFRVQNGATLVFNTPIGQTQEAQVAATYTGTGSLQLTEPPTVFGAASFSVSFTQSLPLTLKPGDTFNFVVSFRPSDSPAVSAQLALPFRETVTPPGSTVATTTLGAVNLGLQGTAPNFVLSYVLQAEQNVVPLSPGGAILFPPTLVNTNSQAQLNISNTGSGSGSVTGISISGTAFRLAGLPLLPVTLAAERSLQVTVLYRPAAVAADTGRITITYANTPPVTINLQGTGMAPSLLYQILQSDPPSAVAPGGIIAFDDTIVGQTTTLLVQVLNTGNASAVVNSVVVSGQGYSVTSGPVLPQTLAPNASITFTMSFTPAAPGPVPGRLVVNSDIFNLVGVGLGARLGFSYVAGDTTVALGPGSAVVFSPVMISQSAFATLIIKNTGTVQTALSNIGIGQSPSPYTVVDLPPLPATIKPGEELAITIRFMPAVLGFSNGTLVVDAATLPLTGSGTQPPPLPSYVIVSPSGTVQPLSQQAIGLTLSSPYPIAISGTLSLAVSGSLAPDPAVLFANGQRTIAFLIPAGGTEAEFTGFGTRVGMQTGTVASTFTLTPGFATQSGGVNLTPDTPVTARFAVALSPPVLSTMQVTVQSANTILLNVTGHTTSRSLTNWRIAFTTTSDVAPPSTEFTIDLRQISAAWFGGSPSQSFGGQFTLSIPILVQGSVPADETLLSKITSISTSVSNELGSSNTQQSKVQ
jgi:hypothetical protein